MNNKESIGCVFESHREDKKEAVPKGKGQPLSRKGEM
jgi:hypothetical protein